jgi:hypothetical protein
MQKEKDIESWDDFISGDFLKPVNVDSDKDAFVCVAVNIETMEDRSVPRLTLERNAKEFAFDLNKTNSVFLKNSGIPNPKALVGKKLYFKKALVRNPKTNLEVEGLRISKVE